MQAGRELDALVAEKVMGWPKPVYITDEIHDPARPIYAWKECHHQHEHGEVCSAWICGKHRFFKAPEYSTSIADAWQVVEKLTTHPVYCALQITFTSSNGWYLEFEENATYHSYGTKDCTLPEAICLAALKAVGYQFPSTKEDI